MDGSDDALARAAALVRGGGVVAAPTDTVWGLSGDARRPDVAARVRALKGRDRRPVLVLIDDLDRVASWIDRLPDALAAVLDARLAATVLLPATPAAPPALVGDEGWIGVRRPGGRAGALCRAAGVPLLSTSANVSGAPAPATRAELADEIVRGVDLVADGPEPAGGAPSTLVRSDGDALVIVRAGAVSAADLARLSGIPTRHIAD